ncbi:MAG: hypothetical protein AABY42_02630, partial [Nitrospirota bacterium]
MKMLLRYIVLAVLGITIAGCGATMQEIKTKSQSVRMDVFSEVKEEGMPPKGFVDLIIKANIKTHLESYYILESKESLHGKQSYPFLINIDGQAALWNVEGVRDNKPAYDKDGKTSHDPEAREGMKYIFEKRIILTAGSHKVFFGLPDDKYSVEVKITLNEGEASVLEFKPIYRTKRIPTRIQTFLKGIDNYEVFLNG